MVDGGLYLDDPTDPGYKSWLHSQDPPGGQIGTTGGPGPGAGGGSGAFFGSASPTVVPAYTPGARAKRYYSNPGFQGWAPAPAATSLPSAAAPRQAAGPMGAGTGAAMPAGTMWDPFAGDTRTDVFGLLNKLVGGAGNAGLYGFNGNPAIATAARERVMGDLGARQAGARTAAALANVNDPSMAANAELQAYLGTQGDASRAGSDAALQEQQRSEDFYRQLLGGWMGNTMQDYENEMQHKRQMAEQGNQGNGLLSGLGQIGGAALGSWLSPGVFWGQSRHSNGHP